MCNTNLQYQFFLKLRNMEKMVITDILSTWSKSLFKSKSSFTIINLLKWELNPYLKSNRICVCLCLSVPKDFPNRWSNMVYGSPLQYCFSYILGRLKIYGGRVHTTILQREITPRKEIINIYCRAAKVRHWRRKHFIYNNIL